MAEGLKVVFSFWKYPSSCTNNRLPKMSKEWTHWSFRVQSSSISSLTSLLLVKLLDLPSSKLFLQPVSTSIYISNKSSELAGTSEFKSISSIFELFDLPQYHYRAWYWQINWSIYWWAWHCLALISIGNYII